jgi:DNA-binding response OmpR family regulator
MTLLDRAMTAVLIYEEDDLMRALLAEWLSDAGYAVRVAASHEAGHSGRADLVILSICMPKQAGLALVREIRSAHPGTPLIALSAQFRSGLSAMGATAGALGVEQVIAKPLTREDLLDAVRSIIGTSH